MTTLVGIKAEKGKKGVILASDLSGTRTRWNSQGDVAYKQQTTSEIQKIYVDKNREVAVCATGVIEPSYTDFLFSIIEGDIDMKEVVEKREFPQLREMNLDRWGGKIPDSQYINSLLIATRFGEPTLYTCWPLGKIEEKKWTSIGSGSDYALEYIGNNKFDKVRFVKLQTPAEINVYANKVIILILTKIPIAIVITNQEAANSFRQYFETIWKIAKY